MTIPFFKYQGAGNDFIVIDNREEQFLSCPDEALITRLCDRRFGIGADGLMLLQNKPDFDFEMVYFNADGREGSMCGNGGRCIVAFAHRLGLIEERAHFLAVDGPHEAVLTRADWVELKMIDVAEIEQESDYFYLDTGSPHYVRFVEDISAIDVVQEGRNVRYSERFKEKGTNVNFVQAGPSGLHIATYERGVEDETLACGTGVTAAALAYYLREGKNTALQVPVQAKGGALSVRFRAGQDGFDQIWLCGPAEFVFTGKIEISREVSR